LNSLYWIIAFTLLGGVVSVLLASFFLLVPEQRRTRSLPLLIAFATGALLGAALLGLLPEAIELAGPQSYRGVGLSLLGGIALFFILEKLVLWRHCHEDHCETHVPRDAHREHSPAALVIVGDSMHNLLDGVLLAASFLIDIRLGIMTGIAVLAHEVPSEIGNFAILLHGGMTRARAFAWNLFSGFGAVVGGILGYFLLSHLRPWLPYALGVSAASLIYVAVADLIPGLHRKVDPRSSLLQVFLIGLGVAVVGAVEYFEPR
jgi:zinc and cadmium transporter